MSLSPTAAEMGNNLWPSDATTSNTIFFNGALLSGLKGLIGPMHTISRRCPELLGVQAAAAAAATAVKVFRL
jgi:hypothetical protein